MYVWRVICTLSALYPLSRQHGRLRLVARHRLAGGPRRRPPRLCGGEGSNTGQTLVESKSGQTLAADAEINEFFASVAFQFTGNKMM
jgi:hypothetical protein